MPVFNMAMVFDSVDTHSEIDLHWLALDAHRVGIRGAETLGAKKLDELVPYLTSKALIQILTADCQCCARAQPSNYL